jgi:hypothetical protein
MMRGNNRKRQRGNQVVEFAFCSVFLVPLFLGTVLLGMRLGRSIQVTQVARDTAHMYARFVDFSRTGNQDMVIRIASGLGMTRTGGNGVVILSQVMRIGDQQCTDGGVAIADCFNRTQSVVIHRVVIGNSSLRASSLATPTPSLIGTDGKIVPWNYLRDASAVATNFASILVLNPGELGYVVEAYFISPELDSFGEYLPNSVYSRCIF